MSDHDDAVAAIDRLHAEAEDLASLARRSPDVFEASALRAEADKRVRKAARLRSQIEEPS